MNRAVATVLALGLATYCTLAAARYVQGDPIGVVPNPTSKAITAADVLRLQRLNHSYVYVRNDPLSYIDPYGLVDWKGTFGGISAIRGAGAGFFTFSLTSECKCNKRVHIEGYVSTISGGLGAKYTGTGGSGEFYDYRDCPDAGIANGGAFIASASSVFGVGVSCTKMTVGHLYSNFSCGGPSYGFDFSAGVYVGASVVTSSREECCNK
jgi:hypothetical protein